MRSANRKRAQHLHGWRQAADTNTFQVASLGDSITRTPVEEGKRLFENLCSLTGSNFGKETPLLDILSHERDQRGSNSCFPFSPRTKKRFDLNLFQAIFSYLRKVKGNSEEQRKGILILYGVSEKGLAGEVIAAGGLKIITEAMQHHPCDEMVQNNGVKALAFFADNGWARDVAGHPQGVVSAIDSNAPIFLLTKAMQKHPSEAVLQMEGIRTLRALADQGWARDVAGVPQGVVSAIDSNAPIFLVTKAMQEHPSEVELQREGIRTFRALADANEGLHEIVVAAGGITLTHGAGKEHPSKLGEEVELAVGSFARSGLGKEVMEMLQRGDSTESKNKDISNPTMRNDTVMTISPPMSETKRTGDSGKISLNKETKRKERVAMRTWNMETNKCAPVQDYDLDSARQQPFTNTANARQRRKSGQKSAHSSTSAVQEVFNTGKSREILTKQSENETDVVAKGLQEEDEQV